MYSGFQRTENVSSDGLFRYWVPPEINDLENLIDDGSTTNSVKLSSDDEDVDDETNSVQDENEDELDTSHGDGKKKRQSIQSSIRINSDIVKFISKREKYKQELCEKLESLYAEVRLVPKKSLIKFTKKTGSRYIQRWKQRCSSIIRTFCGRFGKECLEVKELSRVRKDLPKLGDMLRWSSADCWIDNNKKLAVMTEQSEREQVLKEVMEFVSLENDGKDSYKYNDGNDGSRLP